MKLTRRTLLASAAAVPAVIGLDRLAAAGPTGPALFLYDPALPDAAFRRAAAAAAGQQALAIEGDRIRFARATLADGPALVRGWSRQADALLVEEVAVEEGYRLVSSEVEGAAIAWVLARRA